MTELERKKRTRRGKRGRSSNGTPLALTLGISKGSSFVAGVVQMRIILGSAPARSRLDSRGGSLVFGWFESEMHGDPPLGLRDIRPVPDRLYCSHPTLHMPPC